MFHLHLQVELQILDTQWCSGGGPPRRTDRDPHLRPALQQQQLRGAAAAGGADRATGPQPRPRRGRGGEARAAPGAALHQPARRGPHHQPRPRHQGACLESKIQCVQRCRRY